MMSRMYLPETIFDIVKAQKRGNQYQFLSALNFHYTELKYFRDGVGEDYSHE